MASVLTTVSLLELNTWQEAFKCRTYMVWELSPSSRGRNGRVLPMAVGVYGNFLLHST